MLKELNQWRNEQRDNTTAMRQAVGSSAAAGELESMKARLSELETRVRDTRDEISTRRANVIKNEEQLRNLIQGVSR